MPLVFVGVKTAAGQAGNVCDTLRDVEGVQFVHVVYAGQYDVVLMVEVPTLEAYHDFVQYVLAKHPGIADFESFIAV